MHRARRTIVFPLLAALLALVALEAPVAARSDAGSLAGVTVIGYGEASVTAETATIQFSVVDYNYNPAIAPQDEAQVGATMKPVLDALTAIGVEESEIELIVGPRLIELTKYEGPALALVRVTVDAPTTDRVAEILAAATSGAAAARLSLGTSGVGYGVADCLAVERMARQAAIDDAGERAGLQADLLGVELGDVIASRDLPLAQGTVNGPYGPVPVQSACGPDVPSVTFGTQTLPPFDPTKEAEVTLYAQIELTYEIAFMFGATPAA